MITISIEQLMLAVIAIGIVAGVVVVAILSVRAFRLLGEAEIALREARETAAGLSSLTERGLVIAERLETVASAVERASGPILGKAERAAESTADLARHAAAFGAGLRTAVHAYQDRRRA